LGELVQKPVIGVDLGGTKILAAVLGEDNRILGRDKKKTKADRGAPEVLGRIATVIQGAAEDAGIKLKDIGAIGIGSPGPLDWETGIVTEAPNLGWKNVDLRGYIEKELQVPTFIENDVNVGALAEHRLGAGVGVSDLIGIFVGTGIGGGLIINNQLYRGFNKTAGEIGHMILEVGGPHCGCGGMGCLEALASKTAIGRMIEGELAQGEESVITDMIKKDFNLIKSRVLAEAMEKKDKVVMSVMLRATRYLGLAVGGIINLLSPQMVILGGGVVEAMEEFFVREVKKSAFDYAFPHAAKDVRIVAAKLGDDAGILGAGILARERLREKPPGKKK
jgi:glucokinase